MNATTQAREARNDQKGQLAFVLFPFPFSLFPFPLLLWFLAIALVSAAPAGRAADAFDLVIRNGRIIDGTGSPWYRGDVGVRQGRIAAIGKLDTTNAARVIDAKAMVVAPGFMDMLGQSDLTILVDPHLPSKIFQGITTEFTGEGTSVAPLDDTLVRADQLGYDHYGVRPDWRTFGEYFARLEKQGIGINIASYVGATQVRRMVLRDEDRAPTPAELERMKGLVDQAMGEGAIGLSTALQYAPAPYATTEELIALAREAAKYGGIYASHIRSESDAISAALDEAIRIGREARIPVQIWHLKAAGKENWGRMPQIVAQIEKARASGVDIAANTYAYTAWFNSLSAFVPPWAHEGGDARMIERLKDAKQRARIRQDLLTPSPDWDNEWQEIPGPDAILVGAVQSQTLQSLQGKRISEIATMWHKDPMDTIFDLLIQDAGFTEVAVFAMSEPDVSLALAQPWVSICNDSQGTAPNGLLGREHPHPRAYGTFPRILRKYVREENKLRLEEAIRKFSALPAECMRIADRGVLKAGLWADIVVFDPDAIRDLATFDNPNQLSEGMRYVLVNGIPVIDDGRATDALPGKVLRRIEYRVPNSE